MTNVYLKKKRAEKKTPIASYKRFAKYNPLLFYKEKFRRIFV